jgi:riboflavin synthase
VVVFFFLSFSLLVLFFFFFLCDQAQLINKVESYKNKWDRNGERNRDEREEVAAAAAETKKTRSRFFFFLRSHLGNSARFSFFNSNSTLLSLFPLKFESEMRASASRSSAAACSCSYGSSGVHSRSGGARVTAPMRPRRSASSASASASPSLAAVAALASSQTSSSSSSSRPRARGLSAAPLLLPSLPNRRTSNRSRSSICAPVAVFTGIVQGTATVSSVEIKKSPSASSESAKFTLTFPAGALAGVTVGGSIAINGTCLTVVTADEAEGVSTFDVVGETLRATSLGRLGPGSEANFERAARVGDEIGGHLVSGHVCCVTRVEAVEKDEGGKGGNQNSGNVKMTFRVPSRWGKYILPKGFVSLDGCSLTVGPEVVVAGKQGDETLFSVFFIPETLRVTRFGAVRTGDLVNVEVDATTQAVVDAVERVVDARIEERLTRLGVK